MKILFLCGSLNLGKDGVGDYTRKLACEVIKDGNDAEIISLYDKEENPPLSSIQIYKEISISVTRISQAALTSSRFNIISKQIEQFNPDWISLQYVPFSFNKKGLHFFLIRRLTLLGKGRKWHIMFHELWVGKDRAISQWVLSFLQQIQVKLLLKKLSPKVVHTHLPYYKLKLTEIGCKITPLPLFSNIENHKTANIPKEDKSITLAFFSQVSTNKSVIDFINTFTTNAHKIGLSTNLLLIGGSKMKMQRFKFLFNQLCPNLKSISCTGFLNELEISLHISKCDLGITPVPKHALGKSGSVAAFICHGVPVAAPIINNQYSNFGIGFFNHICCSAVIENADMKSFYVAREFALKTVSLLDTTTVANRFLLDINEGTADVHLKK